ncbi:hypothetical protein TVAG_246610 [Trichomonas vaginalis G3]|uniref:Uncharacterized protein n=1 Tax=Trichomonas vaginalis (strain ATCC PRA-98 / G3) TaxID=412133 RepID=A2DKK0_TRIV3|nr:hypothetical protein TVAGG3_0561420 [Trichomonas vaginalis G3]EAY18983.1 hypothetical protein TVAG_246610 [Trichomonas vaginalis G3]KAI5521224.1 hypothetical protein TVAGG3_0561420 [Trichomonas vaginalis G3]|eukprot:XP_001579969.1 hypothetical protein [Trichomonas vaginalis G3]
MSKDIPKQTKCDVSTDLINRVASIECRHEALNEDIDTPYDHYMQFNQKIEEIFKPDDVARICQQYNVKKPMNNSIPLNIIVISAFRQLQSAIESQNK